MMETTVAYAPKISSGIDVVDETWGGLYLGGSYLVYGRTKGGRGLLPLTFACAGAKGGHRCLYVTSDEFDGLAARARKVRCDLKRWVDAGRLEVVQIPQLGRSHETHDDVLVQALSGLVSEVEEKRPHRVVLDTFMPFVAFRSFGRFRTSFISMLERIDAADATLMLVMAEPANEESEKVIEFMRSQTTAAIHAEPGERDGEGTSKKLTLIPSIGHGNHAAVRSWIVPEEEPAGDRHQSRRFRFAEEEEEALSLRDAQWEADNGAASPERAQREVNGSSAQKREATHEYLITPFKLGAGRREAESTSAASKPAPARPHPQVQSIPLGRFRREEHDQPLTATIAPARPEREPVRESAMRDVPQATPSAEVEPAEQEIEAFSHTDRESFRARLQQRFLRSSVNDVPFLLIAMRMDRQEEVASRPFDFEFILDLVNELLREQDDVYVDLERERLIVLLADTETEGSRRFFAELRRRLREEAPHQADHLLQSVSAIVVPNGRPFQNAEEFLSYALNEA